MLALRNRQAGFSLIEVLVAALVLSIGLVGVAGLQAMSLKNNQSAYMRSQASALLYDLADRMRTNVSAANGGFYDPAQADANPQCGTPAGCSPQEMAENDLSEWLGMLTGKLPMGSGFVCIDSTPNDGTDSADPQCDGTGTQFSIKIWWDDNRDGVINVTAANTERLSINFQL